MEKKGNITYSDAIYLSNLIERIPILEVDKDIRGEWYKTKSLLKPVLVDFNEEKTFILLLNGGIEKKNQQGESYFDEPSYELRKDFKGDDKQYKESLIETKNIKRTLFNLITELGEQKTGVTIKAFMNDKQFESILKLVQSSEFDSLRSILVKGETKEYKDLKVA